MFTRLTTQLRNWTRNRQLANRRWAGKTLVIGPAQPVDGDSVACTAAVLAHLRKKGLEAYTLPTLAMYSQIDWILTRDDVHQACHHLMRKDFTTSNLQEAYDALLAVWTPDEVVLVDGHIPGFDLRGIKQYMIDHHVRPGVGEVDDDSAFIKLAPSVGCLLIEHFGIVEPILAVSILTDTFWFRQNNPAQAVRHMAVLTENGLTDQLLSIYQKRMMVHKDSRILALMRDSDMRFALNGEVAFVALKENDPEIHRGVMGELGYFCHHMCVVRGDGYISFRTTDDRLDLRPLATKYGRGGHAKQAAGQVDAKDSTALDRLFEDFVAVCAPFEVAESAKR
jgi:nanoRNase/pAp phosphatase (c-di-AMP/oligoRNAs hydrolase)